VATNLLRAGAGSASVEHIGTTVRAPKTAELISSALRRQIVRGELQPQDLLPSEAELMSQFGVSRPTLREAFRILETENLITIRRGAHGGAQVTVPDVSVAARYVGVLLQMQGATIADVSLARMVTEPACAGLLARVRTKSDLADLRAVVTDMLATTGIRDSARWTHLSYRFHELVAERCGNKTLAIQVAMLQDIVARHMGTAISRDMTDPARSAPFKRQVRSFEKLIELLEARDVEGAERHWRAHLDAAAKSMSRTLPMDRRVVELFA
jgi:GntR family transcriptional repressor for pyruvate dehydrogenase complex